MFKDIYGWIQLGIFVILLICLTKPVGIYLAKVLDPSGRTFLDPFLKPVEKFIYEDIRYKPLPKLRHGRRIFFLCYYSVLSGS